jgi:hypothetical protein
MSNGLAPWRSLTASMVPHNLDGVLLPAYVLRCLFVPVWAACAGGAACLCCLRCLRSQAKLGCPTGIC